MVKPFLIAAVFILSGVCAHAHAATYTVTLTNGNIIQANSYRVEKGKVFLKYPVGEGAFSISQVASITAEGGNVNLLQSEGELKPAADLTAPKKEINQVKISPMGQNRIKREIKKPDPVKAREAAEANSKANAQADAASDDLEFFTGLSEDEKAFLKGEKDIADIEEKGGGVKEEADRKK